MSVQNNSTMFRYIQSVIMPFAYTEPYVPDIAVGMDRLVKWGNVVPRTYTLTPNDVLEVLLIAPNYYTLWNTYSKQAVLLSRVNPTLVSDLDSRYTISNDVFQEFETNDCPGYLHKANACITATGITRFEGVYYQKTISDLAPAMASITSYGNKVDFNVPAGHQLWMNYMPMPTEKRVMNGDANRPGQCMHHMGRFTNITASNIQITVTGVMLLEKTDISYSITPKVMKQTPLGLAAQIFECLRAWNTFVVHNPYDATLAKQKRIEARKSIVWALTFVVNQWSGMMSALPGINPKKLINFIIFYLE